MHPKLSTLARIREFFGDGKKTAGLILILLGLAFIPLTGGGSLMTLKLGMTLVISASAGLGIGSGFCLVGLVLLLWAGHQPISEQNAGPNRSVCSPAPPKKCSSDRVRALVKERDLVKQKQASNIRAEWVSTLTNAEKARLESDLLMHTGDVHNVRLTQLNADILALEENQRVLMEWAREKRKNNGLEPYAELRLLGLVEEEKFALEAQRQSLLS